jgi:hypothetical protein
VYDFLYDLGVITTKSVWPTLGASTPIVGGTTCADPDYLAWTLQLQKRGFEIALHNATYHTSTRQGAIEGLARFREYFGAYPNIQVNHAGCRENIYWGDARVTGVNRLFYNLFTRFRSRGRFQGTDPSSDLFWGDMLKQHVQYVRNFVFAEINTLKVCPFMPYYDPLRPFVNYWFASSEGADCESFCRTICEANQDRLESEGGGCIMYTHFGKDFSDNGKLNEIFRRLMERLSKKNGWFVPVSTMLDFLRRQRGHRDITPRQRRRLERRWLWEKVFVTRGTT